MFVRCLRTLERASQRVGCVVGVGVGARPAQGAATTTDKGLVRTLERAYIHLDMILCCTLAARTIDRLSDLNVYT